jgi:diguanylate cyclase (GGDEF)-like protein
VTPRLIPAGLDLADLSLPGLLRCGDAIRDLGRAATGFDGAARSIVRHLRGELRHPVSGQGCDLVCLYRTRRHPHPAPDGGDAGGTALQSLGSLGGAEAAALALVARAAAGGDRSDAPGPAVPEAIGAADRQAAALLPVIARLVRQLGVEAPRAAALAPELVPDRGRGRSHVFLVPGLATPGLAGDGDRVRIPEIGSVLGFGDRLPSGEHVAVVLFSRTPVSRQAASLLGVLAHSVTLALLPFLDDRGGERLPALGASERREAAAPAEAESPQALRSRVVSLERLLDAQEQAALALRRTVPSPTGEEELRGRPQRGTPVQLGHRSRLCDRAAEALLAAAGSGQQVSLVLLDLDGFRVVNDTLGHRAVEELLQTAGDRMRGAVRPRDTVVHLGADEFAVLLPAADAVAATAVARRLLEALRAPFRVDGEAVHLGASLGVAASEGSIPPATSAAGDRLVAHADLALYAAKAGGRGAVQVYDRTLHQSALRRLALDAELRRVEDREFFLEYQPVVSLADAGLDGAEALLRWRHPSRGLVGPGDFIAAAEANGQIVRIGAWVLETACREAAGWDRRAPSGRRPSIAVNVSCRQLREQGFAETVLQTLRGTGLRPSQLVLEVTESVLVEDLEAARTQLEQVRAQGVRIAVDDFGAGFSSLGYLRALPLDIVKIDRMFVTDLGTSEEDRALTLAIVRLLGTVDARIVAEGIETSAQLAYVHALGIDAGQGFYLGRPVAPGVFSRLLEHRVADWDGILDSHGDADARRQRSAALSVLSALPVRLRTVLVEDDPALRAQLRALLEGVGDVDVVGETGRGGQAVEAAAAARPDVILVGARTAAEGDAGVVRSLRSRCPQSRIVVVSALGATERRAEAERLGADEYIATGTSLSGVVSVLRDAGAPRTQPPGRHLRRERVRGHCG